MTFVPLKKRELKIWSSPNKCIDCLDKFIALYGKKQQCKDCMEKECLTEAKKQLCTFPKVCQREQLEGRRCKSCRVLDSVFGTEVKP